MVSTIILEFGTPCSSFGANATTAARAGFLPSSATWSRAPTHYKVNGSEDMQLTVKHQKLSTKPMCA